jgi:DNA-binding NtrC family response regulator
MSLRSGIFREDLFFRLNRFQINVPPLRSRGGDIVLLARFFIQDSAKALRKGAILLTPEVEDILLAYGWPGNVRELRNVMERAVILCEGSEVTISHLPGEIQSSGFVGEQIDKGFGTMPPLAEMECQYILHVVRNSEGNLSKAARILGISRNTLKAKLPKPKDLPSDASGT